MYTVMVTGGIGSGKSKLVELLCERGAVSIDLDEINRRLITSNAMLISELAERFGEGILDEDGSVVPSRLASVAFADEQSTRDLNAISFPYITEAATNYILNVECVPRTDAKILVVEVPLLTEAPEFAQLADEVIAVTAPSDLRLARAVARGMDAPDVLARMRMQPTDAERALIADTVCENICSIEELGNWVDAWYDERMEMLENQES
mgnify:FL=1